MKEPIADPAEPVVPMHWAQTVVSESLTCRQCRYDLRGLPASGRCPECGADIWTSVLYTVDPEASRLRTLRNPRAVGNALFILTLCMFAGTLMMTAAPVASLLHAITASSAPWLRFDWLRAGVIGLFGVWALWLLKPPAGSEPHGAVWVDLGRVGAGLLGWLLFAAWWLDYPEGPDGIDLREGLVLRLTSGVLATIGLIGLRGVLVIIGERSREYRRSKGGKQSLELIIAAIVAGMVAALVKHTTLYYGWLSGDWRSGLRMLCTAVIWSSTFMVLVGLGYLVMNGWWIRNALCRPSPPLDQVLMPKLSDDTWIPDREE